MIETPEATTPDPMMKLEPDGVAPSSATTSRSPLLQWPQLHRSPVTRQLLRDRHQPRCLPVCDPGPRADSGRPGRRGSRRHDGIAFT